MANALRMVEIAARTDIPVAAGARAPLKRMLVTATSHGMNGLGGIEFPVPETRPVNERRRRSSGESLAAVREECRL